MSSGLDTKGGGIFLSGLGWGTGAAAQAAGDVGAVVEAGAVEDTLGSGLGHHVVEAVDGEEALKLLEQNPDLMPDLLIADMVMPRMGGLELAKVFSKKQPQATILLVSGYPEQQGIAASSGYAFLKKPFAVGELITRVGSLLEHF